MSNQALLTALQPGMVTRIQRGDWGNTSTQSLRVPVATGDHYEAVCLGPNDESGGVTLQASDYGEEKLIVSARAPIILPFTKDIIVGQIFGASSRNHELDLLFYRQLPYQVPQRRGVQYKTGGAATMVDTVIRTFGRRRVQIFVDTTNGTSSSLTITAIFANDSRDFVSGETIAAAGPPFTYQFDVSVKPASPGTAETGITCPDYIILKNTGGITYQVTLED